jgi:hypothetical protein
MKQKLKEWKRSLGEALVRWGSSLLPPSPPRPTRKPLRPSLKPRPPSEALKISPLPPVGSKVSPSATADAQCPGVREPLSVESAVLKRDMTVLKREAADALAALGAAHALVTSARLAQVQEVRNRFENGEVEGDVVVAMAGDYQGWQNDQVRLFDALSLVLRMRVPQGNVLDQVDPGLHEQARSHLEALSVEYQRRLLIEQFPGR